MTFGLFICFGVCFTAFPCRVIKASQSERAELCFLLGRSWMSAELLLRNGKTQTLVVLQWSVHSLPKLWVNSIADGTVEGNEMFGHLMLARPGSVRCDGGLSAQARTEQKSEASLAGLKSHFAWWQETWREYTAGEMLGWIHPSLCFTPCYEISWISRAGAWLDPVVSRINTLLGSLASAHSTIFDFLCHFGQAN